MSVWTRRQLRRAVASATGATALGKLGWGRGSLAAVSAGAAADEFNGLRARWFELLTGGSAVDPDDPLFAGRLTGIGRGATSLRETMAPSSTALWDDLPFDASSSVTGSYTRLQRMALAHASPGHRVDRGRRVGRRRGRRP